MNAPSDYSGHLINARKKLQDVEEAAALGNFQMALAYLIDAQRELGAINLSLTSLAGAQPGRRRL